MKSEQFDSKTIVYRSTQAQRDKRNLRYQLSILLDQKNGLLLVIIGLKYSVDQ